MWRAIVRSSRVFGLRMDNRWMKFTGDEAAQQVSIPNGAHGVAGVLAWPGRHCAPMGRKLPRSWRRTRPPRGSCYSMPAAMAPLFATVCAKVEGAYVTECPSVRRKHPLSVMESGCFARTAK